MYLNLISPNAFPRIALPAPAALRSYEDALHTVYYYIGKYADEINALAESRGFEARQRLLYMLVKFVFCWREMNLPAQALEDEVPQLIAWAGEQAEAPAAAG